MQGLPYDSRVYQYRFLPPGQIRILRLHPAEVTSHNLTCDIFHLPLSDNVNYTALSYVWGNVDETAIIRVGDEFLFIGMNLYSALVNLRRRDRTVWLWVDAVCINQYDVQERNHQVENMRHIYEFATETVVYLGGQEGNTCHAAWNFLERKATWALNSDQERDSNLPGIVEDIVDFRGDISDVYNGVLCREWFTRVWVLQEVVVSKDIIIQCSKRAISWDDFIKIVLTQAPVYDRYGAFIRQFELSEAVRRMWRARVAYQLSKDQTDHLPSWYQEALGEEETSSEMLDMVVCAKHLNASDPRDKIIALLGISTGFDWKAFGTIDYNKTTRDVYVQFARDLMKTTSSYSILSYASGLRYKLSDTEQSESSLSSKILELPSWVPDWRSSGPMNGESRSIREAVLKLLPELSSTPINQSLFFKHQTFVDDDTLIIHGRVLGHVSSVISATAITGLEKHFQASMEEWKRQPEPKDFSLEAEMLRLWAVVLDEVACVETPDGIRSRPKELQPSAAFPETSADISHRAVRYLTLMSKLPLKSHRLAELGVGSFLESLEHPELPPKTGSVEAMLIDRVMKPYVQVEGDSRTWIFTADNLSLVDNYRAISLVDTYGEDRAGVPSSTEDKVKSELGPSRKKLALLPRAVHPDDLVVYFPDSEVPFVVRPKSETTTVAEAGKDFGGLPFVTGENKLIECELLGECWVNDFIEMSKEQKDFDHVFVIH